MLNSADSKRISRIGVSTWRAVSLWMPGVAPDIVEALVKEDSIMNRRQIGILLTIVGFLLFFMAFFSIPAIPRKAREVYRETMHQPDSVTGDKSWFTNHREWYYDAHLKRMYLQNIYVASAGLVLAMGGLAFLSTSTSTKNALHPRDGSPSRT